MTLIMLICNSINDCDGMEDGSIQDYDKKRWRMSEVNWARGITVDEITFNWWIQARIS